MRDFSAFALQMILGYENTAGQEAIYSTMMKKPGMNSEEAERVWTGQVYSLRDQYTMNA